MKTEKRKTNKKIIFGMFFVIVLLFATYSYAIASTTLSVSDMKIKNIKIADLQTEISELESEYFSIINNISVDINEYNLEEINNVGYASLDKEIKVAYNY